MFVTESVRHCPICNTVTPHSRRRPLVFVLWIGAMMLGTASTIQSAIGALVVIILAIAIVAKLERKWEDRCNRCRDKARREIAKTKPGRHSEISIL